MSTVAQLCYDQAVRQVLFTDDAVRHFKNLPRVVKPTITGAVRLHLIAEDPALPNRLTPPTK